MGPVPQLTCQEEYNDHSGVQRPILWRCSSKANNSWAEDDIKPFLRLSHISRYHYEDSIIYIAFVRLKKRLAWLCSTYGGMIEHSMVVPVFVKILRPVLCSTLLFGRLVPQFLCSSSNHGLWMLGSLVLLPCRTSPIPQTLTPSRTSANPLTSLTMQSWRGEQNWPSFKLSFICLKRGFGSYRKRQARFEKHLQSCLRSTGWTGPTKRTREIFNHTTICNWNTDEVLYKSFPIFLWSLLWSLLGLSTLTEELLSFLISGGRFLVTGNDCPAQ